MFSNEEFMRYMRQMMLDGFHREGQVKLKTAKVLVVGAGGLGCPILQYLTAVGIGTIGIVEYDVVDITNLHRQILYRQEDIGKYKIDVAKIILQAQNPFVEIIPYREKMEFGNAAALIADYDIVIDGCDNFQTRYLVNDICVQLGKSLVYGSVLGYEGQLALFNHAGGKNLRDIFPHPPDPKDVPDCSTNGVMGTVPGIIGTCMAQIAICTILGDASWKDKFVLMNTMDMTTVELSI